MSGSVPPTTTAPRNHSTLQVILSFAPYLWPKGNLGARIRVATAVLFMVAAKAATVYVPILYSRTIDALTQPERLVVALPIALILGYGLARIGAAGFGEIRDALFASVSQRAVRRVALQTYQHLHRVSLRFHLDRQTGGLSRVIDLSATPGTGVGDGQTDTVIVDGSTANDLLNAPVVALG